MNLGCGLNPHLPLHPLKQPSLQPITASPPHTSWSCNPSSHCAELSGPAGRQLNSNIFLKYLFRVDCLLRAEGHTGWQNRSKVKPDQAGQTPSSLSLGVRKRSSAILLGHPDVQEASTSRSLTFRKPSRGVPSLSPKIPGAFFSLVQDFDIRHKLKPGFPETGSLSFSPSPLAQPCNSWSNHLSSPLCSRNPIVSFHFL